MRRFRCLICGLEFNEDEALVDEDGALRCPKCRASQDQFEEIEPTEALESIANLETIESPLPEKRDIGIRFLDEIHQMAATGETIVASMGIEQQIPSWDDILLLGAQLDPMPLESDVPIKTETVIGRRALKPMVLQGPIYISHMSFGSLSREAKIALARGSAMAHTATCSGEGGILDEEIEAAYKYIYEYVPNLYSYSPENLHRADAIEIKIGQGTKPGMGGHLPASKVTEEIAQVRGKEPGKDIISPARFKDINSKEDLKRLVDRLRSESEGRPIGIKLAAGRIEQDLDFCVYAGVDFVTIDGHGGGSGASPLLLRDSSSVPTIYALSRARRYLDSVQSDIALIITGGLRVSSDFAKALAMGADAVAIATAALMALGCEQFRICETGKCPTGIATQDPELRARLDIDAAAQRVTNFLDVSLAELQAYARLTGHEDIHDLGINDLCTINREISDYTDIVHA